MSDFLGNRIGMRGRLWWLFFCQMTGSVMCVLLGIGSVQSNLANTIGIICVFSFFIEAACGATYGIYPFVSHRALGRSFFPVGTESMPGMSFGVPPVFSLKLDNSVLYIWSCWWLTSRDRSSHP